MIWVCAGRTGGGRAVRWVKGAEFNKGNALPVAAGKIERGKHDAQLLFIS